MKIKVLVKYHNKNFKLESFGNWIDLKSIEDVEFKKNENKLVKLNVSMKLPKYFQANIVPRSSTMKNFKLIQGNHYGVVDGGDKYSDGYSGNDDIWMFNGIALEKTKVEMGDRICQFEIKLSMNAPFWVKLKWLFSSGFDFVETEDLKTKNRGGFGTSGKK